MRTNSVDFEGIESLVAGDGVESRSLERRADTEGDSEGAGWTPLDAAQPRRSTYAKTSKKVPKKSIIKTKNYNSNHEEGHIFKAFNPQVSDRTFKLTRKWATQFLSKYFLCLLFFLPFTRVQNLLLRETLDDAAFILDPFPTSSREPDFRLRPIPPTRTATVALLELIPTCKSQGCTCIIKPKWPKAAQRLLPFLLHS